MAEYISRDAVITRFKQMRLGEHGLIEKMFADGVYTVIENIPAADVAPVVHGRWSDAGWGELPKHAPYGWACSVCENISFNSEHNYCPHCGAKMDGGDGNEAD